jgi:dolichol-phosphate hexosyltransferase
MNPLRQPATIPGLVTIVLPAKNEADAIGHTIRGLPLSTLRAMGYEAEVVVLDGNSKDRTAQIARENGATVIPDQEPGKGAAFRNAVPRFRGEFTVMLDADGTYPTDTIPRVLAALARGDADVVMGVRQPRPGSMSPSHMIGNAVLSLFATMIFARLCPDVCTGLWGFQTRSLRRLPLESQGFGLEAELFSLSTRLGLRVGQTRIDYLPRFGAAKLNGGADGLRILRRLMRARFLPLVEPAPETPSPSPQPSPTEVQA